MAGTPASCAPGGWSPKMIAPPPSCTPSPVVTWSLVPDRPPNMENRPSFVEPEMPTKPASSEPAPTWAPWPICTWLSSLLPASITVSCSAPRSTEVLVPISTSSPITARDTWGTLTWPAAEGAKPKPSPPMTAPGLSHTRSPRTHSSSRMLPGIIRQSAPTEAPRPT